MIRRAVLPGVAIAVGLLGAGCTGGGPSTPVVPDDPGAKVEVREEGGWHGGRWSLTVDRAGRYTYRHSNGDGRGGRMEGECEGTLEPTSAQAWIDRVAALPLVPYEDAAYRAMAGTPDGRSSVYYLVYHPSTGVPLMPADASTHESVLREAVGWLSGYGDRRQGAETCK